MKDYCDPLEFAEEISVDIDTEIESLGRAKIPSPVNLPSQCFVNEEHRVTLRVNYQYLKGVLSEGKEAPSLELAGPRPFIYFDPSKVKVGIVTCGGLCPGINDVIRSIVMTLFYSYGVNKILGFQYGLQGFIPKYGHPVIELTPEVVKDIHTQGGTFLGTSRGHQPVEEIVDTLERLNIQILFMIGGDGTFRAANKIKDEIAKRGLKIAVIAIPKTIDNDIWLVSKTFGFDTAVELACEAIRCAHTEARAVPYGIGLVKLMGRHSGFIAAAATLATKEVNFCLVPEMDFDLEGEQGFLAELEKRLLARKHAVIVIAEGAGQKYVIKDPPEYDASGNVKLGDIGKFVKEKIEEYFKKRGLEIVIRYIDPSYIIRSVPANVEDRIYCGFLGQYAVHAGMAGKTGLMISYLNEQFVHIPLKEAVKKRKQINLHSRFWLSVLESTGQRGLKNPS
ncbi:diphosphate--fructose-6-phosphate 1-phosphotransferase [Caldimicrobium thiodismutans]|uniref:ATP-dependent 6-phosphofructokinase n=1 Tax=Caldimicrobium thiodismutans TaxID=1653476 RepID=A0A0U4W361_9BACT|nr:ATP-dependent 6-phosphofructokinase [Caldimicrobium thiodismutans]BAU23533.1 diphosphate--fructose-6-phosphate 1-phosphotransferase [Caldimicrobium thiodismutans]